VDCARGCNLLRIECGSERRLALGAALLKLGNDGLHPLERQIVANRQHQGQCFGEPVAPVPVCELLLDGGLGISAGTMPTA
jgi:hypothetical protein